MSYDKEKLTKYLADAETGSVELVCNSEADARRLSFALRRIQNTNLGLGLKALAVKISIIGSTLTLSPRLPPVEFKQKAAP